MRKAKGPALMGGARARPAPGRGRPRANVIGSPAAAVNVVPPAIRTSQRPAAADQVNARDAAE